MPATAKKAKAKGPLHEIIGVPGWVFCVGLVFLLYFIRWLDQQD